MYQSGSLYGTVIFTVGEYYSPYFVTLDNENNLYISSPKGVYRWIRGTEFPVSTDILPSLSGYKIQIDNNGNIYTLLYGMSYPKGIIKYRRKSNIC